MLEPSSIWALATGVSHLSTRNLRPDRLRHVAHGRHGFLAPDYLFNVQRLSEAYRVAGLEPAEVFVLARERTRELPRSLLCCRNIALCGQRARRTRIPQPQLGGTARPQVPVLQSAGFSSTRPGVELLKDIPGCPLREGGRAALTRFPKLDLDTYPASTTSRFFSYPSPRGGTASLGSRHLFQLAASGPLRIVTLPRLPTSRMRSPIARFLATYAPARRRRRSGSDTARS